MGLSIRPQALPEQVVTELLASTAHREVLRTLADARRPRRIEDVARELAVEQQSSAERRALSPGVWLYQDVLPKLTATGVVEFDSACATVPIFSSFRQ